MPDWSDSVLVNRFCIVLKLFHVFVIINSLIHSIVTRIIKLANSHSQKALAPALVETYSRLLVYMEIELLGIKGFISKISFENFKFHFVIQVH